MLRVVRQTCIAPDYILVHESVKAEFTKKLLEFIPKNFGA
jgi:acyl-CoA reductase-like NAD-dependent aldehyde dehydrogenase